MDDHHAIETKRLILRPLRPEHAEALHETYANADAMRFWQEPPHEDLDATRAMIGGLIVGSERAWVLSHRDGKDGIGLVYYLGNVGAPGMGYILSPHYWRRGLMSEAVRGALEHGFTHLGFDRVELWIDTRNLASQRVAERTGFTRRAAFRQKYAHDSQSHEKLVYGLRIEEWRPGTVARSTRPIQAYSLQPVLAVPDVRAAAEYYRDRLGFTVGFLFGEPPTYAGLWLGDWSATGANIHLSRTDGSVPAERLALYTNVGPGIDDLYETYRVRGVDLIGSVVQQPWGMREFALRDCNGYILRFGTPG